MDSNIVVHLSRLYLWKIRTGPTRLPGKWAFGPLGRWAVGRSRGTRACFSKAHILYWGVWNLNKLSLLNYEINYELPASCGNVQDDLPSILFTEWQILDQSVYKQRTWTRTFITCMFHGMGWYLSWSSSSVFWELLSKTPKHCPCHFSIWEIDEILSPHKFEAV